MGVVKNIALTAEEGKAGNIRVLDGPEAVGMLGNFPSGLAELAVPTEGRAAHHMLVSHAVLFRVRQEGGKLAAGSGIPSRSEPWLTLTEECGVFPPTLKGLLGAAENSLQKNKASLTPCGVWLAKCTLGCPERTGRRLGLL